MTKFDSVAAFVLAGGASARMGRDKALLQLEGQPLLVRAARLVEPLVHSVTVIAPTAPYEQYGLPVVPDDAPGLGPLGGIATALRVSAVPWCLLLACDLPYMRRDFLEFLIERAQEARREAGGDALLPLGARGPEPLCALYHVACRDAVRGALHRGVRKITDALTNLSILFLPRRDWIRFDSDGRLFKNMNSPADYDEAVAHFAGRPRGG